MLSQHEHIHPWQRQKKVKDISVGHFGPWCCQKPSAKQTHKKGFSLLIAIFFGINIFWVMEFTLSITLWCDANRKCSVATETVWCYRGSLLPSLIASHPLRSSRISPRERKVRERRENGGDVFPDRNLGCNKNQPQMFHIISIHTVVCWRLQVQWVCTFETFIPLSTGSLSSRVHSAVKDVITKMIDAVKIWLRWFWVETFKGLRWSVYLSQRGKQIAYVMFLNTEARILTYCVVASAEIFNVRWSLVGSHIYYAIAEGISEKSHLDRDDGKDCI